MPGLMGNRIRTRDPNKWYNIGKGPDTTNAQPQQGGLMGGFNPSMIKSFTGGGASTPAAAGGEAGQGGISAMTSSGGGAGGGIGAVGMGAIIAAAIAAQHYMSTKTDTEFEGQKTKDAFSGNFGTEPWFAFLSDKLGWEPTAGEKFDAAISNRDWGLAAKRFPAMSSYWADPARAWTVKAIREKFGNTAADIIDPSSWVSRKIEDIF